MSNLLRGRTYLERNGKVALEHGISELGFGVDFGFVLLV